MVEFWRTVVWCALAVVGAYMMLPGFVAHVGAVVGPLVIIITTITAYKKEKK